MKKGLACKFLMVIPLSTLLVGTALGLSGCGGSGDTSSAASSVGTSTSAEKPQGGEPEGDGVDVGIGKPIPLTLEDLRIAFVASAQSLPGAVEQKEGVERVAAKYGVPVTTFDSQFDVARQFALYQTVIDSGKYNSIITQPLSGNQECDILSKTAPSKEIVVSVILAPLCGREFAPAKGDGMWAPGTLSVVGNAANSEAQEALAKACAKETGGGETILLNGFPGSPNYQAMTKAYEDAGAFDIVANYATSYASDEALEKTTAALSAHPNLKVIASTYAELTEGALQALKSAGKEPGVDIKLCSQTGGTEKMIAAVESGELAVDNYSNSEWIAMAATQSVIDAAQGKPTPHVIVPGEDGTVVKSGTVVWPPVYTKEDASQYAPTRSAG